MPSTFRPKLDMHAVEPPIAQRVRDFVARHPVIAESLAMGIVNHSSLARRIMDDEGIARPDAVLKALTRLQEQLQDGPESNGVREAVQGSRLEVRTRVAMLSYESTWQVLEALTRRAKAVVDDDERIHILHGWEALTAVAHEDVLQDIRAALPDGAEIDYRSNLAEINVRTASPLDNVPGFVAEIASALARRRIPVVDATTCRRDHIFVIAEDDVAEAVTAIESLRS